MKIGEKVVEISSKTHIIYFNIFEHHILVKRSIQTIRCHFFLQVVALFSSRFSHFGIFNEIKYAKVNSMKTLTNSK